MGTFQRAVVAVVFTFFLMASLRELPIAEVIAILYASPLILAAIAPSMLRETVGTHRWIALLIAFAGVLVMMGSVQRASIGLHFYRSPLPV